MLSFQQIDRVWLRFAPLFVLLFAADQVSKWLALRTLELGERVDFGFNLSHNDGIVFGLQLPLWLIFVLSAAILSFGTYLGLTQKLWRDVWHLHGLALILAGALGNLADRVRLGYVIDFIQVYWWPTFNLADAFLVLGVALFAWSAFFREHEIAQL